MQLNCRWMKFKVWLNDFVLFVAIFARYAADRWLQSRSMPGYSNKIGYL